MEQVTANVNTNHKDVLNNTDLFIKAGAVMELANLISDETTIKPSNTDAFITLMRGVAPSLQALMFDVLDSVNELPEIIHVTNPFGGGCGIVKNNTDEPIKLDELLTAGELEFNGRALTHTDRHAVQVLLYGLGGNA